MNADARGLRLPVRLHHPPPLAGQRAPVGQGAARSAGGGGDCLHPCGVAFVHPPVGRNDRAALRRVLDSPSDLLYNTQDSKMSDVRGMTYVSLNKWVRTKLSEAAYEEFLEALPEKPRDILLHAVEKDWYPEENVYAVYKQVVKTIGKGDDSVLREFGEFTAKDNLGSFMRGLIAFASPEMVIKRTPLFWPRYNNGGRMTVDRLRPGAATITMWDHYGGGEVCPAIEGWVIAAVKMARGKEVEMTHPVCRYRTNADRCVWEVRWR